MIWAEEQIPQDGAPVAHLHILIQQGRLGDGVHQDLERTEENGVIKIQRFLNYCHNTFGTNCI